MTPLEEATEMVQLAGGEEEMTKRAREAFEMEDYQWTMELCEHLMLVNKEHEEAKVLNNCSI